MINTRFILLLIFNISIIQTSGQPANIEWGKTFETEKIFFDNWHNNRGKAIAVSQDGSIFSTGIFTHKVDFDPGPDSLHHSGFFTGEMYVSKLSSNGEFEFAGAFGTYAYCRKLILDTEDNVIISGSIEGPTDFDPGPNEYLVNEMGAPGFFILKLDQDGNLMWVKPFYFFSAIDHNPIALASNDQIISAGSFGNTVDIDPGGETQNLTAQGTSDGYILSLNEMGELSWVTQITGPGQIYCKTLETDADDNIIISGTYRDSIDFDPGPGEYFHSTGEFSQSFVAKYNSSGAFLWVRVFDFNPTYDHAPEGIVVDNSGNIIISGIYFGNVDFDPGSEIFELPPGNSTIYASKMSGSGDFIWAKRIGGKNSGSIFDWTHPIAIDDNENIYITGNLEEADDFDPGPDSLILTSVGYNDIFMSKLDADGNLLWAFAHGSDYEDKAGAITVDNAQNVYLTGNFNETISFNPGDVEVTANSILNEIFVLKLAQNTVGLTENTIDKHNISIYPNPTNNHFNIRLNRPVRELKVFVFDSRGRQVFQTSVKKTNHSTVDLSHHPAGLYSLQLVSENEISSHKVIKR